MEIEMNISLNPSAKWSTLQRMRYRDKKKGNESWN